VPGRPASRGYHATLHVDREADPAKSREHVLLSLLAERRFRNGQGADLEALLHDLAEPPIDQVGALEVNDFLSKTDRKSLAAALNSLLASPTFAGWREGATLDVAEWLTLRNGRTPAVILSVAHLEDEERALVLGALLRHCPSPLGISCIPNQNSPRDSQSQKPFMFNYLRARRFNAGPAMIDPMTGVLRVALLAVLTVRTAHAQSAEAQGPSASDARVTIDATQASIRLRITPVDSDELVADCKGQCVFWAPPGRYTLNATNLATGAHHQLGLHVERPSNFELNEGDDTAKYAGLALGVTGSAAIVAGLFMVAPVVLSAMCEDSSCTTSSQRRTANVGLGFLLGGAVATPVGWVMFSRNRTRLVAGPASAGAYAEPGIRVGLLGLPPGVFGLGGMARF